MFCFQELFMKRLFGSALLAVVAIFALESQASAGLFRQSRGCNDCGSGYGGGYGSVAVVADCAPAPVQFVEQKVIQYRQVMVEREIESIISRPVTREEKFVYDVRVPVTTQEKRVETFFTSVQKEVAFNYTVCVPVTVQEKRTVTEFIRVEKQVPYTYTVMVPRTVQKTVKVTSFQCVTENVTEMRPVCQVVSVPCVDACGNCFTRCERVTVMQPFTRCIVKRIPIVSDVVVNETICEAQVRQGTRVVCELVPQPREVIVNVCRIETRPMVGKKMICELVPQSREVLVNVCSFAVEKRTGTRLICDMVQEKVKQKVQVCQMVAEEVVVRVPVCAPTTSYYPVDTGCNQGGWFRRGRCCH